MIVLGVDPGTATTGFGVVRRESSGQLTLVECGVIRTRSRDSLSSRLRDIHDGVAELMARHHPDLVSVEDVFYSRNVRTTVVLGHARGVILLAAEQNGIPVREYPPAEIKKCVAGNGAATKEQIQFMLSRLLRLRAVPQPADAADGVAAALACLLVAHLPALPPPDQALPQPTRGRPAAR